ncbi:disease resistance protein RUN1-like [Malus domestica]|uniref:disease resistance protein RUN1-like n=1 Tax=Malus domestica TaxID=3750 RepID=UPI003975EC59
MAAHGASSSSSSSKLWKYDVFLSFRGEDTRKGFTGHLHTALEEKGYKAFIDEDDLERGEEIKPELLRAIEKSRISIIVFSKRYADSSWCLDELVKIMECKSELEQHVLPIFYDVEASDIRKQEGSLAPMFQKHEENIRKEEDDKKRETKRERVKQWRKTLTEAANLSGYDLKNTENGHEAKLIKKIIYDNLWKWLPKTKKLHVAKFPVGINSRVQEIITYLSSGEGNKVLMVGIWGMGGLGKTTAAKAIYNQIHPKFEFKSFLDDVSDTTSRHGLVYLQKKLISDILNPKSEISSDVEGIGRIKDIFSHRKVFVVMDNIDKKEQLDAIVGNHDWFGPGSRIIITTRDKHLLLNMDKVYSAQKLKDGESLELFSWHAFGNSWPDKEYLELSKKFVSYCDGLPLALEVLGSFLFKRTIGEWECQLKKLKTTPEGEIIKPLRISFEGLDDTQKAIFLDISCFFIGMDKDFVTKVLDECKFFATIGINVLSERSLVTVERNKLNMHDLLREMARVIISGKSPCHPEKWSRLWNPQDVSNVLTNKLGTRKIEGLALEFPHPLLSSIVDTEIAASFSTEAFANMKNLRLLHLDRVELKGEYKHLPKELIWLCWEECPLKSIPDDFFNQPRLVVLDMRRSNLVQVWEGSKSLHNLKTLDLSDSYSLQKSPDFSQVPNLEELILKYCISLSEIHPSIGHLKRLSLVNLTWCFKLISLPEDFYKLKSVETLLLNWCSKFREVHEDIGEMISLRILEAEETAIRKVPPSIVRLKNLTRLSLSGVESIHLPFSLHGLNSLRELNLEWCNLADDAIPKDLGSLISLQDLDLSLNTFHTLPSLSGLSKLVTLRLIGCISLRTIPDLPTTLKFLYAFQCLALETMPNFSKMLNMKELVVSDSPKLTEVPGLDKSLSSITWISMLKCTSLSAHLRKNILQGWTSCGFGGIFLHGNYVPDWFEFVNEGTKVTFDIPPSDGRNFEGLTLFCLYHSYRSSHLAIIVINNTQRTELRAYIGRVESDYHPNGDDYLLQGQLSNNKLKLRGGDKVVIFFENPSITIKRTGVNLVWDKPMEENMHDLDKAGYVFDTHPTRFYDEEGPSHDASDNNRPKKQMRITIDD